MSRGGRGSRALRVLSRHLCSSTGGIRYRPLHLPPLPTTPGGPPQLSERPFGLEMDIDLAAPLALHAAAEIRESLHRHGLLLFRRQSLTPQRQIEVTEACWGPVEPHPLRSRPGLLGDRVLVMRNGGDSKARGARNDFWHSDISNVERPPLVSVLHAIDVPEGKGDTLFVNMATWLASCREELQDSLESLAAVHSSASLVRRNSAEGVAANTILAPPPAVTHPVVRSHPITGERALYVNQFFTERFCGMNERESAPLLAQLMASATRPERVYRHRWRGGDVLVWDNALLMHYAELDYEATDHRHMHRTTAAAPGSSSSSSSSGDGRAGQRPSLVARAGGGSLLPI